MTSKTIAVFGAGAGLGTSIAKRFGREGYRVALVARRHDPLRALRAELLATGIEAEAFPADLSDPTRAPELVATIRKHFGRIDVLHYAPAPSKDFTPAAELDADTLRGLLDLFLLTPVELVRAVLPEMLERGDGAILVGQGTSAAHGHPGMSGIGPAMAAMRNYVQSLHAELATRGVYAGMLTVAAMVDRSAAYHRLLSGEFTLPKALELPEGARPEGPAEGAATAGAGAAAAAAAAGAAGAVPAGAGAAGSAGTEAGAAGAVLAGEAAAAAGAAVGGGVRLGVVDPDDLAEACWALVTERDRVEVVLPVPFGA
ncbi:SDR family NAD(P)-dependent oxidoreductase [Saccharothrix xinjiangensis]|uniref:SDR family NAD(P)-dependent oxidoreductase n=1 Tax=Saccharothrix xinjiangensis TaxID=204798 RepID=A0ABV9XSU9_9PSEU